MSCEVELSYDTIIVIICVALWLGLCMIVAARNLGQETILKMLDAFEAAHRRFTDSQK